MALPAEFRGSVFMKDGLTKATFCLAAAVTAAAIVDPLVERLSNSGVFGAGTFTDNSNLDVIPALGIGLILSLLFIAGIARRAVGRRWSAPAWLRSDALAGSDRSLPKLLPAIFGAQMLALWTMETLEQIVVAGHPLGGTVWLGGPTIASILLHAAGCIAVTWILSRTLHWSAQAIVEAVAFIRYLFCGRRRNRAARPRRVLEIRTFRFLEPIIARLNGRAPPCLSA